jgi:protein-tyrosine-phosphatase
MRVLFICKANVFRSQIATAIYNNLADNGSTAESYGTAVDYEGTEGTSLSSYPELSEYLEFMKSKGMDISDNNCRQITAEALTNASQVILILESEFVPTWLNSHPHEFWSIPNPTYLDLQLIESYYEILYKKVVDLIRELH